jgi:cytosolic prostaglandin-E synthase
LLNLQIKWAQRKDSLYVTIDLRDISEEKIDLTATKLTFSCKSGGNDFNGEIEFIKEVDPESSTWKVLPRSIQMHIMKKDQEEEYWPRLLKDKNLEKGKVNLDWDKYVDEDEENGGFDTSNLEGGSQFGGGGGGGGMPPGMDMASMMGGMGGMPGMGGPGGAGGMDMAALQQMMAQVRRKN